MQTANYQHPVNESESALTRQARLGLTNRTESQIESDQPNRVSIWSQLELGHLPNTLPGMEGIWLRQYVDFLAEQINQPVALIQIHVEGMLLTVSGQSSKSAPIEAIGQTVGMQGDSAEKMLENAFASLEMTIARLLEVHPELPILVDFDHIPAGESHREIQLICGDCEKLDSDIEACLRQTKFDNVKADMHVIGISAVTRDLRWQLAQKSHPDITFITGPKRISPCGYKQLVQIHFPEDVQLLHPSQSWSYLKASLNQLDHCQQTNAHSHLEKMRVTRFIKALGQSSTKEKSVHLEKTSLPIASPIPSPVLARLGQVDMADVVRLTQNEFENIIDLLPIESVESQSLLKASCPDWPEVKVILDTLGQLHLVRILTHLNEQNRDQELLLGLAELAEARNWISGNLQTISEASLSHVIADCQAPILHLVTDELQAGKRIAGRLKSAAHIYLLKSKTLGSSRVLQCEPIC